MFSKETYVNRRSELKRRVGKGLIVLFGNDDTPINYPANVYTPMRQDSSFLYYFGQHRHGLVGIIDTDNDAEWLVGDDIDIDDIVWMGSVDTVSEMAQEVGVAHSAPMSQLATIIAKAKAAGQTIHFLPPYRHSTMLQIQDLLGVHHSGQKAAASLTLIKAIVAMRSRKTADEVALLDKACDVGYIMHTTAMRVCRPGVTETFVSGQVDGIARSYADQTSFGTICSQHGEIMHGMPKPVALESGRLLICDAGCEYEGYSSDNTRTLPIGGRFTQQQRDIYQIVADCHDLAIEQAKPGVKWFDVHLDVCRMITDGLKDLGLMKGDTDEAVAAGAHALFLPHGLGHMMGLDVHDMENLGQIHVGFDEETRPNLTQFGTNCLRMGRRLEEGFVLTDEPGIYFIPALIDEWQSKGLYRDFINYQRLDAYRNFGGVRIEDDILITADGCRMLGTKRIPYLPHDVEAFMANN